MTWWGKAKEAPRLWWKTFQLTMRREGVLYAAFESIRLTWAMLRLKQ